METTSQIYAFFLYEYTDKEIVNEAFDLRHVPKYYFWQNWQATNSLKNLALDLVRNLPDHEGDWSVVFSRTFEDYVGHIFHSVKKQGFMVVTNRDYPVENVHLFFQEVVTLYKKNPKLDYPIPNDQRQKLTNKLNQHLTQLLVHWNDNAPSETKLGQIDDDLTEIKEALNESIQKIIHRGESIEELLQKSQHITETSKIFLKRSRKLNTCCLLL